MARLFTVIGIGVCFILGSFSLSFAQSESLTITTYYPSPYGSYNKLQANSLGVGDNNNSGSLDSGDVPGGAGDVWIKGNVGIGTMTPTQKLEVNGRITIDVGGSASKAVCWKADKTLGYCSTAVDAIGGCTCN